MRKKTVQPRASASAKLTRLRQLIDAKIVAEVELSWKGAGDPAEIPVKEAYAEYCSIALETHIAQMEREEGSQ